MEIVLSILFPYQPIHVCNLVTENAILGVSERGGGGSGVTNSMLDND